MKILVSVTLLSLLKATVAIHCQEEMNYHEKYGYGYDICCNNLNASNVEELRSVEVYNEIVISIDASAFNLSSDMFRNLQKAREIYIHNCKLNYSNKPFEQLHQLELLAILNSSLTNFTKDFLSDLLELKVLNISGNSLSSIEKGALKNENLEELDFSRNYFKAAGDAICEAKKLRTLHLSYNQLTYLNVTCLKFLTRLNANHNSLHQIVPFSNMKYLKHVDLAFNKISNLSMLSGLENLESLNIEGNLLTNVKNVHFKSPSLRILNLRSNLIENVSLKNISLFELVLEQNKLNNFPILDLPKLKSLSLSKNRIELLKGRLDNLPSLQYLNLSHCSVNKLSVNYFQNLRTLKILDLSYNSFPLEKSIFLNLGTLVELYLQSNSYKILPDFAFQSLKKLAILDLSLNKLQSVNNLTFYSLHSLEILNLSYNSLQEVSNDVFESLQSLKTLDLSGNQIKIIDYDYIVSHLANLKLIIIRENQLSCDFLQEMLTYFHNKKIEVTVNERLSYDVENVAGIPCHEDRLNASSLILEDDNEPVTLSSSKTLNKTFVLLGLISAGIFISVVTLSYKIYMVLKRRNLFSDEIELLDARLQKSNNYI